ncbi:2-octaprenyl-3-methyl-6-methoxy-1,4-benzoquinol hydroxylase [Colwellia chukchiensis]|uniref:2-octaprenyl-3-methyl-6-methoxy-1,4-benzoquinol hydroxylase n=1 Tax=Colwellia chukchiensis TaxID=641665 RepID=A0A1H7GE02_9GAMM|nr:FAD-dependent oxidoreductase [Colwellia chukchiensis]SEK36369.1 2-octaprenyl-3-methyl-6-methoxy-1,4-benzoquinol hydroxylase [Colwellia chukchiensis]
MNQFDCVVVGGGMVGAASALSLAELGLKVAVIEKYAPEAFAAEQAFDLRVSAISLGTEQLLTQLGAWQALTQWRICPYKRLAVWERAESYTEFSADAIQQSHLGHIVENRLLQLALWQQLQQHTNVTLMCPENVKNLAQDATGVKLTLASKVIEASLVVAADGANSMVRKLAHIGTTGWDYAQSAMLINVATQQPQQDITWQQYLPTGPLAMLPMPGQHACLVWYHQKAEIKRLASLSDQQLTQAVQQHFPERLGAVAVLNKAAFSLTRRHANQYYKNRVVLVGDAAHSINPMAGQGVNLGFKDVKALQQVIAQAISDGESWHNEQVLARYQQKRRTDNLLMMTTMDALYLSFSHVSPLVKLARNAGLMLANKVPSIKNKALAYACGIKLS